MKVKSLSFMGIILATVLLSSMFLVSITISEFPPEPQGAYSVWGDLNDDGKIDILDIVWMAGHYGTTGTPINKTQLLLDLLLKIEQLNTTIIEQQNTISLLNETVNYLNTTVINLNETVTILNSTGLGAPDYDSGWVSIGAGQTRQFVHNLGSLELLVYVVGQTYETYSYVDSPLCQILYGGNNFIYPGGEEYHNGFWWYAVNENRIDVRNFGVQCAGNPHHVRVIIWKIPQP
jgi:hypothetical protein